MVSCPTHCAQIFSLFYYLFCIDASHPYCIHPSILHLCYTHVSAHPSCISEFYMHISTHVSIYPTSTNLSTPHPCILQAPSHPANDISCIPKSTMHIRASFSRIHLSIDPFSIPALSKQPRIYWSIQSIPTTYFIQTLATRWRQDSQIKQSP